MGEIQGAFNKAVYALTAGSILRQKMKTAEKNVKDVKMAKLEQRAKREKFKADIEKSKLQRIQYKIKQTDLKMEKTKASIGGSQIRDPQLLAKIKEASK